VRCETFLKRYDRLDAREGPDSAMLRHLAACDSCRAGVELMRKAMPELSGTEPACSPAEASIEERVMSLVRLSPRPRPELFTVRDWLIAGSILFLSIALMPFGHDFERLFSVFGTSFALPMALVLGGGITVYGALFIGTHVDEAMDFVRRKIIHES